MRLPVVGRFLGLDEIPCQRQMDRVKRLLHQSGRFRRRRDGAEPAAKRRFEARLTLPADAEDLFDVSVDEAVGDFIGAVERGLGCAVNVVGFRQCDGPAEGAGRAADFLLKIGGDLQAAHLPVGGLTAQLIHLAAGQFDEKLIGVRPFHERGRRAHEEAGLGDGPRSDEVAAVVLGARGRQLAGGEAQLGRPGHVVGAAREAGSLQFFGGFGRDVAGKR